ncbi:hypothetical protein V8C86DRAFT_653599 [Haematococcus lacustris]
MSTSDDGSIDRLEKEIAAFNEKADLLEKDIKNAEEKEQQQLRKETCLLRAQLVELCKEKTILQGKKAATQAHAERMAEIAAQTHAAQVAAEAAAQAHAKRMAEIAAQTHAAQVAAEAAAQAHAERVAGAEIAAQTHAAQVAAEAAAQAHAERVAGAEIAAQTHAAQVAAEAAAQAHAKRMAEIAAQTHAAQVAAEAAAQAHAKRMAGAGTGKAPTMPWDQGTPWDQITYGIKSLWAYLIPAYHPCEENKKRR